MLKASYDGTSVLKIVEHPLRELHDNEVLIKIDSATICGTDIHILDGEFSAAKDIALGHEFAGVVEKIGKNVTVCKEGDKVSVEPHIFCGVCKFCRVGKVQECIHKIAFGVHKDGGFAQKVIVPDFTVYVLPEGVSCEEGALVETIGCCMHGVELAEISAGDTVVILGGGVIGVIMVKLAKLYGAAKVIVSEPIQARRSLMLEKGADYAIDPFNENVLEKVALYTHGLGADVVIEAAGRAQTAEQTIDIAGSCARILFFGVVPPGQNITLSPNTIFLKELKIIGSRINPFVHHRAIELLKRLDVADLITHRFPLSKANEAINNAKNAIGLKTCIKPNMEE